MNYDLDAALRRLAEMPVHPGLANMEAAVLARISAHDPGDRRAAVRLGVLAALGAVAMGVAGANVTSTATAQPATLSPFGPSTPLAPSTLLASL